MIKTTQVGLKSAAKGRLKSWSISNSHLCVWLYTVSYRATNGPATYWDTQRFHLVALFHRLQH